jgi:hypothetical protein
MSEPYEVRYFRGPDWEKLSAGERAEWRLIWVPNRNYDAGIFARVDDLGWTELVGRGEWQGKKVQNSRTIPDE